MKLHLNFFIKGLDDADMVDCQASKILANVLAFHNKTNSIKLTEYALRFFKVDEVDVDNTDFDLIYKIVSETDSIPNITKYRILKYMDSTK